MTIEDAQQYKVQLNDVFIVRGNGSKELVGRAGLIEECKNIVIFPDLFIKVPLDETKILPRFFVAWWNSPFMRMKIVDLAKTTSGIWKINQGHIASCEIPVLPLDEQRRIVAYLDSVQARLASLRELQSATGEELSALLPSVLDRAFKGEL
jgi:type I restriction enzyme S subunit